MFPRHIHRGRGSRQAMTIVELLIVIAIVGILISLLLPAVQAARETARRAECTNNLRQIGLACLQHEEVHGFFPSSGWGYQWAGDPDRGYGKGQPGGWIYNILEYLEASHIRAIGLGLPGPGPGGQKYEALKEQKMAVLPLLYCPSRRAAQLYPAANEAINAGPTDLQSKNDYAANGGSLTDGTNWEFYVLGPGPDIDCLDTYSNCGWPDEGTMTEEQRAELHASRDGITHQRSEIRISQVTDGTSQTLLVGEKYINPWLYEAEVSDAMRADNNCPFQGNDFDTIRWVGQSLLPRQDTPGVGEDYAFGSAHPYSMNAVFVDGSVHRISYDIDPLVYEACGSRNGGEVVEAL